MRFHSPLPAGMAAQPLFHSTLPLFLSIGHPPPPPPCLTEKKGMVAGNGAAGFYLTKEQRPIETAETAAVSGGESWRCVPASLRFPPSISNPRVGGAWLRTSAFLVSPL